MRRTLLMLAALLPTAAAADDLIVTVENLTRDGQIARITMNVYNPLPRDINMAFIECWSLDKNEKSIEIITIIARNVRSRAAVKASGAFTLAASQISGGACRFTHLSNQDRQ